MDLMGFLLKDTCLGLVMVLVLVWHQRVGVKEKRAFHRPTSKDLPPIWSGASKMVTSDIEIGGSDHDDDRGTVRELDIVHFSDLNSFSREFASV
ncbi:hypothetical protein CRYUN_Cryun22dG0062200 [Craigia yunnanensis]